MRRSAILGWRRAVVTLAGLWAAGCGSDGPTDWELATPLFDPDRVLLVDIEMAPADWDTLRQQTRTLEDLFGRPNCMDSPWPDPFTYFPATVTVDGEPLTDVMVRKKGFIGSLDTDKPSLKISMNEIDPEGRYLGLEKMTLNNSVQDGSYVNQCVTYDLFARAGMPAPRCNFAHVTVNGADLGVYVHVESMEDALMEGLFGDASGNLYEGTLSDFRPGWTGTFEKKNNRSEADWSDLDAVVAAAAAEDDALIAALEEVIDLDQFIRFWALEAIVRHWDGYAGNSNNFWIYRDGERFQFLPWGTDQVLADRNPVQGNDAPTSIYASSLLPWRLLQLEEGRARYEAALRALLDEVWDEAALLAELDRIQALIAPHVASGEVAEPIDRRRSFISERRAELLAELEDGLPGWNFGLRQPVCR
ncbi:MAG TPA: CotH kinase family protein [Kofleriaceae bacterium]|nr:CotH kinase family protein [Kofleriaceae bacterium]